MRRIALLDLAEAPRVIVVLFPDFGRIDADGRAERGRRKRQVVKLYLLRHLERARVRVEEGLHRRVIDLDVLDKGIGLDVGLCGHALLIEQAQVALDIAPGNDVGAVDRFLQRSQRESLAHTLGERDRRLRRVLPGKQLLVACLRELAVFLEGRNVGDELAQLLVGNG